MSMPMVSQADLSNAISALRSEMMELEGKRRQLSGVDSGDTAFILICTCLQLLCYLGVHHTLSGGGRAIGRGGARERAGEHAVLQAGVESQTRTSNDPATCSTDNLF